MNDYVQNLNIRHFERLLLNETDPDKRAMIERLLLREKARLLSGFLDPAP
jgi:hypothetical protein